MIKRILRRLFLTAAIVMVSSAAAVAEPSCSVWMWQNGGWYWQQCVNDDGTTHCYHADDANGTNAYEISCSS